MSSQLITITTTSIYDGMLSVNGWSSECRENSGRWKSKPRICQGLIAGRSRDIVRWWLTKGDSPKGQGAIVWRCLTKGDSSKGQGTTVRRGLPKEKWGNSWSKARSERRVELIVRLISNEWYMDSSRYLCYSLFATRSQLIFRDQSFIARRVTPLHSQSTTVALRLWSRWRLFTQVITKLRVTIASRW